MTMNRSLAEFCGLVKVPNSDDTFVPPVTCWFTTEGRCPKTSPMRMTPDFSGKDFHLLHTAMGERDLWDRLGAFLAVHDEDFPYDSLLAEVELHRRSFAEQAKLIYEFIEEDV